MIANRRLALLALLSGLLLVGGGCGERAPSVETKPQSSVALVTKTFTLRGKVREVEPKQKAVTIAHEAMPGFMGAMTMPFTVEKEEILEDVRPGDQVEGPISVVFEGDRVKSYKLEGLEVTDPAPLELKLNLGGNGPTLSKKVPVLKPGEEVPDFTMTTQEGKILKLSDLKGKVVVLTFIYTRCPLPDFCPASDAAFNELAKLLGEVRERAEHVRLLSVSFDPEHDTVEVLKTHAKRRGAVPPVWNFAVASHEELSKVAERLGLTYGPMKNEIIHNLTTAVIGPDGKLVELKLGKAGAGWTVSGLAKTVVDRLRESGK